MLLAPPCVPPSVSSLTTEYLTPVSCGRLPAGSRPATVTSASRITPVMHVSALGFMLIPLFISFRRRATEPPVCLFPVHCRMQGFRSCQTPPCGSSSLQPESNASATALRRDVGTNRPETGTKVLDEGTSGDGVD